MTDDELDELEALLWGIGPHDRALLDDAAHTLWWLRYGRVNVAEHASPCLFPRACAVCAAR